MLYVAVHNQRLMGCVVLTDVKFIWEVVLCFEKDALWHHIPTVVPIFAPTF
jgi:hypothetical protein